MKASNIVFTLIALVVFTAAGYWLGTRSGSDGMDMSNADTAMSQQDSKAGKGKKADGDREILYWQAPMNPSEIYDEPGKSKMGMDLVPVYADEQSSSEGQVSINPVVEQNMNVRTAKVERSDLSTTVRAVGRVTYDERKLYRVNPKISGWIEKLYVDVTGQPVRKGQPLFSIYSPQLVTTQREYLLALDTRDKVSQSSYSPIREGGSKLLDAARKRLEYWDVPESEIKQLRQTREIRKTLVMDAPASGIVVHKNAVEGEHVKAGSDVYQVADLSTVWVQVGIYDYEVPWVREGQPVEMELTYQPGKVYHGKVAYIYPDVDEKTRTVQVRLEFPNPELELKPGMYASARISAHTVKDAVVIPSEAVIRTGERNVAFVDLGGGKFEPRELKLGMEGGENNSRLQVLEGLKPGEKVVTSAQFLLDSESKLQEAIQKMLKQSSGKQDMSGMDMPGDSTMQAVPDSSGAGKDASHANHQM